MARGKSRRSRNRERDPDETGSGSESDDSDSHVEYASASKRSKPRDYTRSEDSEDSGSGSDSDDNPFSSSSESEEQETPSRRGSKQPSSKTKTKICRQCFYPVEFNDPKADYKKRLCSDCVRNPDRKRLRSRVESSRDLDLEDQSGKTTVTATVSTSTARPSKSRLVSASTSSSSRSTRSVYTFTLVPKRGHPMENRIIGSTKCFALEGELGKTLYVTRGSRYNFELIQSQNERGGYDHQLMFTTDPLGGNGDVLCCAGYTPGKLNGTPDPIGAGTFVLHIREDFPEIFYYQSTTHAGMGGLVVVCNRPST